MTMISSIGPETPTASDLDLGRTRAGADVLRDGEYFEQPVPRKYVHRASVAEVLITGFARDVQPDTFLLAAQWPRGHSYYHTVGSMHDPLLFAETIRQAGLFISHVGYGAPLDAIAVMHGLSYDISPEGLHCDGTPSNLILEATCRDTRFRRGQLAGFNLAVRLRRGIETVGFGTGELALVSTAAYRRLRGSERPRSGDRVPAPLPAPVAPKLVGRRSAVDVVLSPTDLPDTWLLRCDASHPVLFDHPVDHVPGMVLIEAMRQASHAALGGDVVMVAYAGRFERYAELDAQCEVRARLDPAAVAFGKPVRVEVVQDGATVAVGGCAMREVGSNW